MCYLIDHHVFFIHLNLSARSIDEGKQRIGQLRYSVIKMCDQHRKINGGPLAITEPNIVRPAQKTGECYYVTYSVDVMAR